MGTFVWAGGLRRLGATLGASTLATQSLLLFANNAQGAVAGVLFWTVAAHTYGVAAVGATTALVSSATLLGVLANLGAAPVALRYLPLAGRDARRLAAVTTLAPALVALVAGLLLAASPLGPRLSPGLPPGPLASLVPALIAAATTAALSLDSVATARGRAGLVLARGVAGGATRLALLLPLAWLGPSGLALVAAAGAGASALVGARLPARDERPAQLPPARELARFGATSYLSGLFSQTPQLLYPAMVAAVLSPAATGAFAFAWMVAALTMTLAPAVGSAAMARLAAQPAAAIAPAARRVALGAAGATAGLALAAWPAAMLYARVLPPEAAAGLGVALPALLVAAIVYAGVRVRSLALALAGRLRAQLALNGAVAAAALAGPALLLPRMGLAGLALGWLGAQLLGLLLPLPAARREQP